uniref:WW domain-containing protein n=1 Tax=Alexandrium monilatum TaxID=311494 RepID=A0A7S4R608_9DINO
MACGELLEVTVHVDRSLGLSQVKSLRAGTTVAELKDELARDDPTGCLQPQDIILGCAGRKLSDAHRITADLVDLDLLQADAVQEPVVEAIVAVAPAATSTALALATVSAAAPSPAAAASPPAAQPAEVAGAGAATADTGGDWVHYKTADGKAYFHDAASGRTQWEEPTTWRNLEHAKPAEASPDNVLWIRYTDAEGKPYYHDAASGRTQWEEPMNWTDPPQASSAASEALRRAARAAAALAEGGVEPESAARACAHPLCTFRVHSSGAVSTTHCCRICKNTPRDQEPSHGGRCERWPVDGERPTPAPAPAPAPASAPAPAPPAATGVADKNSLHKLFESLDRGGGGQVSRRDVLVALRRHPPVRRLFGLPVTNVEPGGDALEARLLAIQDSFEAGSGLGELAPAFDKLREASGGGQSFSLEAFLASCRTGPLRAGARQAAALLPREHATGAAFVPTHLWAEVPGDAVCPGGLEYKMDMSTGKTLARLPPGVAAAA